MTFLAWFLEFIASVSLFIIYFVLIGNREPYEKPQYETFWVIAFDASINSIIIPLAYILKTEENKEQVISSGWTQGLRNRVRVQSTVAGASSTFNIFWNYVSENN